MKDQYVRRGLLQGNTTIQTDGVPTLTGQVLFSYVNGELICENLLNGKNSAQMIIYVDILGEERWDIISFTSNTAEHVLSMINAITYVDNEVDPATTKPVYHATIINSCLVISAPNSTYMRIEGVINSSVANASYGFGFSSVPDPRGISVSGELSSSPSRNDAPSHNKVSYISKYEDRTSESINRAVDSVALNVEDIYLNDSETRPKIASMSMSYKTYAQINEYKNDSTPKAFYVRAPDSAQYTAAVATGSHSIYTPLELTASYETFRDAYQATYATSVLPIKYSITDDNNNESIKVDRIPGVSNGGLTGIQSTFGDSVYINPSNRRICIGDQVQIGNTLTANSYLQDVTQQYGKVERAGVFKGSNLFKYSGEFNVIDQVTIRLTEDLPTILRQPGFIIALTSEKFCFGYRITAVVDYDKLIVEPLQDIEYRLGATILRKDNSHTLSLGASGSFDLFLGDSLPIGTSLVLPLNGSILTIDPQISYLRSLVTSNNRSLIRKSQRSDQDLFGVITELLDKVKSMNSPQLNNVVDSLHALMNSSTCSRSAAFRMPNTPYALRLSDTYSDSVFGPRLNSGGISTISGSSEDIEKLIIVIARQGLTSSDISSISNEIYSSAIKSKYLQIAYYLTLSDMLDANTEVTTVYGIKTIEQLAQEFSGTVNEDNPLARFINLLVLSCAPFSVPYNSSTVVTSDGIINVYPSTNFRVQDLGRDFELKSSTDTFIVRMVEFYTTSSCRFIDLETGLNIKDGTYTSISGLFGIPQQQAINHVYLNNGDKCVKEIVISNNENGTSSAELTKLYDLNVLSKFGIGLFTNSSKTSLYMSFPYEEFFTNSQLRAGLIYSLPVFDVFRLTGVHNLTPQFTKVGIDYTPAYNHSSRSVVYITLILNKVNYSGFYEVKRCIPNILASTIIFEIEAITGQAGYARTMSNLINDVAQIDFLDTAPLFIVTDEALEDITPCPSCTLYEMTEFNSYKKVSDFNASIVQQNYVDLSTQNTDPALTINANNSRTAIYLDNQDSDYKGLISRTSGVVPLVKVTDTTPSLTSTYNSIKNVNSQGVSMATKYSTRPTVLIEKTTDIDESAIAINRTLDVDAKSPSNGLVSIRDDSEEVRSEVGYCLDQSALYVEGNTILNGKVAIVSDNRNSNDYLTNKNGTGINSVGGIDSHLNPTTCAAVSTNTSVNNQLTHGEYEDELLPAHLEYGKFLGEYHILKTITADRFDLQVGSEQQTYTDIQLYFNVASDIKGSDQGRSCRLETLTNKYEGYIYSVGNSVCSIRLKSGSVVFSNLVKLVVFGREWNANLHRASVSKTLNFIDTNRNSIAGSIYVDEDGNVILPYLRETSFDAKVYTVEPTLQGGTSFATIVGDLPDMSRVIPMYTPSESIYGYTGDEPDLDLNIYDYLFDPNANIVFNKDSEAYERFASSNFPQLSGKMMLIQVDSDISAIDIGLSNWTSNPVGASVANKSYYSESFVQPLYRGNVYFVSELRGVDINDGYMRADFRVNVTNTLYRQFNNVGIGYVSEEIGKSYKYYVIGCFEFSFANETLLLVYPGNWWINTCLNSLISKIENVHLRSVNSIRAKYESDDSYSSTVSTTDNSFMINLNSMYSKLKMVQSYGSSLQYLMSDTAIDLSHIPINQYTVCSVNNVDTNEGLLSTSTSFPTLNKTTVGQVASASILSAFKDTNSIQSSQSPVEWSFAVTLAINSCVQVLNSVPINAGRFVFPTNDLLGKNSVMQYIMRNGQIEQEFSSLRPEGLFATISIKAYLNNDPPN